MEMVRTNTAPGQRYPTYSAAHPPYWLVAAGSVLCLAIWAVLKYLEFTIGKTQLLIIILPGMGLVLGYLLAHRIRAYLDPMIFKQEGFLWRDEIHRWDTVRDVEQRERMSGLVEISMEFPYRGARIRRALWLSKNQDPNGMFLELRWLTRGSLSVGDTERSHDALEDVSSVAEQENP